MNDPATILSELNPKNSGDWRRVGDVMRRLNQISEVSVEGRPWHDIVLEVLAANGHSISSGHLHRIRRAYHFLEMGMIEREIPAERAVMAKISSIDQAERLFQLDAAAGLDALEACLAIKKPATKADIQQRYEDYLSAHPEKKTAMQAAWDRRRKKGRDCKASTMDDQNASMPPNSISDMLDQISQYVTQLETASKRDAAQIAALKQEVLDLNADLIDTKQRLQITAEEFLSLQQKLDATRD